MTFQVYVDNYSKLYCHMVYYIKDRGAIFDAFQKIRQIDGILRAMDFFPRDFLVQ